MRALILAVLLATGTLAHASTWNEPWHGDVLRQADTLGLYEVVAIDADRIELRRVKTLAGQETQDSLEVTGLYLMPNLHGHHDHGQDERLAWVSAGDRGYFLLKKVDGSWQLPTPSSGAAGLLPDGQVAATYRASFHMAIQPADAYERVQPCLFRALHGGECDVAALAADLDAPLQEVPARLAGHDSHLFFRQHVALESAALLKRSLPLATIEPFLALDDYHVQLSAVRALGVNADPERNARLLAFIKDVTRTAAARVMAVRMAAESGDAELIATVKAFGPDAPADEAGLGLNIMDPRIGTRFPSTVAAAIAEL